MTDLEILQGTISAIVYQNYENGYAVLRMNTDNSQSITVVGTIPMPAVGECLMVTGKWGNHPNFGRQFEAEFLERLMPQSASDILSYLSSRIIKGIGPKTAAKIVSRFQENTLRIIEQMPEQLAEVPGISLDKAKSISEAFRLQVGMRHILEFFTLHHLPAELAVKTYKLYGESTVELLYDDPYLLMDDGLDAPFGAVDHFAVEIGIAADDPRRIDAGVIFELRYNRTAGHSFLPEDKLLIATAQLLTIDSECVLDSIARLLEAKRLVRDYLAGIHVLYLPEMHEAEILCARRLLESATLTFPVKTKLDKLMRQISQTCSIEYSPQQEQAIRQAAESGLLIITGGPGTGKTTIVNGILALYDQMGLSCVLAAPTGRAAKRLTEVTNRDASTIHRLLEAGIDPHTGNLFFGKDAGNPIKADAVIVDEMSMVDVLLLYNLLSAIPSKTRLIFVGDPDQLPPVGPGFPLNDMLRSGMLPSVKLTEIFRQAQQSLIVTNAHRINQGEMPILRDVKNDFFFLPCRSEEDVAQTIIALCSMRLPKNMGVTPEQIQVLSPTKRGFAGTVNLNKLLQQKLNPADNGKKERPFGDYIFREGDRVMQIRNNYDIIWKKTDGSAVGTGIFNGDIGTITQIDVLSEQLTIVFDDREVDYDFSELNELEPAYAMTVHKSQGSEYRAVVLAAWNGSPYLLNRSILYTSVTRAKELLVIVGQEQTIATMVQNAKVGRRYTGLKLRLQGKDV